MVKTRKRAAKKAAKAPKRKPPAKTKRPRNAAVAKAVELDLKALPKIASHALAASARALARDLDDPETSPHTKAQCARALQDALDRLRELAPPVEGKDKLDDLRRRHDSRRARGARRPAP